MVSIDKPVETVDPRFRTLEKIFATSPLTRINDPVLRRCNVELWIKRDDLLHSVISGNKWRKLKYILAHALSLTIDTLVSMGGAYSNHLHALAYAGRILNLKTVGMVRGGEPAVLNPTLRDLRDWGMELHFVSRSEYRQLRQYKDWNSHPAFKASAYWLPEGGAAPLALRGVSEIVREIGMDYDYLCMPCGSGATLAGLVSAAPEVALLGFAALKGGEFLQEQVEALLPHEIRPPCRWSIISDYHFGGLAKTTPVLHDFIGAFVASAGIALEPVYTGKMLYGIYDLAQQGYFSAGARIIALHTGGLQGNRGFVHAQAVGT
jgi:1-aminocyclopropane-1-carboxylate deaminase